MMVQGGWLMRKNMFGSMKGMGDILRNAIIMIRGCGKIDVERGWGGW